MTRYLLILAAALMWSSASAHDWIHPVKGKIDAGWIMKNPATRSCCGPADCEPVPGKVSWTPLGWAVRGLGGTVPQHATYPSIDGQPWACRNLRTNKIRCLFLPKGGQ